MSPLAQKIACPKCTRPISPEAFNRQEFLTCPTCRTPNRVEVFPALFRQDEGVSAQSIETLGGSDAQEAACFYHQGKRAVVPCDTCGRFLCSLCDLNVSGQHICPSCLESGKKKGTLKELQTERIRYDHIALSVAYLPVILLPFIWFTCITGPLSVYYSIKHWNSPLGLTGGSKVRFGFAIAAGVIQSLTWMYFVTKWIWGE